MNNDYLKAVIIQFQIEKLNEKLEKVFSEYFEGNIESKDNDLLLFEVFNDYETTITLLDDILLDYCGSSNDVRWYLKDIFHKKKGLIKESDSPSLARELSIYAELLSKNGGDSNKNDGSGKPPKTRET